MQYSIHSDKVVIRRGSLPLAIALVVGGALLAIFFWDSRPLSSTGSYSTRKLFLFSLVLIIYGVVSLVRAFQVVVIDKDGIRGGGMGKLKWADVRQMKMEQQDCFTLLSSRFFSNYDSYWGICIKSVSGETFLKFPEDRPHMDLVQAINGIAPFDVTIDTEAYSEYRKAVNTYEQNKSAAKETPAPAAEEKGPTEEEKPVDNSFTTPVIIGIVLMLLFVGLIVWRLTQI